MRLFLTLVNKLFDKIISYSRIRRFFFYYNCYVTANHPFFPAYYTIHVKVLNGLFMIYDFRTGQLENDHFITAQSLYHLFTNEFFDEIHICHKYKIDAQEAQKYYDRFFTNSKIERKKIHD